MSDAEPVAAAASRFPTRATVRGARQEARRRFAPAPGLGVAAILPLFLGRGSNALETMVQALAYVVMALA
jgi:hypothetical protein